MNPPAIKIHFSKKRSGYLGGTLPIYLRLTIDGDRSEFSTQREVDPRSEAAQLARNHFEERRVTATQQFLETLESQFYEARRDLLNKGKEVTVAAIKK